MEAFCSSEGLMAKASQLWTMLDDMAESSPESYRQFIQQQLNNAKQYDAPPEPYLCLEVQILTFRSRLRRTSASPLKMFSAAENETSGRKEPYSIFDIAYNPSVLEWVKNALEKDHLIRLSLKFTEERYNITLSPAYSIAKFKLKGSLERMRRSLRGQQATVPPPKKGTKNEMTLNQLRNITAQEGDRNLILPVENPVPSKPFLIEEISSTEKPGEQKLPNYEVTTRQDAHGKALKLEVKVEVPEVHCVSECNLSISKDDLLFECPQKYRLHLNLPEPVEEKTASARFFKKKRVLLITMSVCQ